MPCAIRPRRRASWTARDSNRSWDAVASSADGSKLVAAAWGDQIYTSTDSGLTWTARDASRAWQAVASSSDGSKLVAWPEGGRSARRDRLGGDMGAHDPLAAGLRCQPARPAAAGRRRLAGGGGLAYTSAAGRNVGTAAA
jgi:hypothetical protein